MPRLLHSATDFLFLVSPASMHRVPPPSSYPVSAA